MAQLDWMKKIAVKMDSDNNPIFKKSVEEQENYLRKIGIPNSDLERSFFQYKCQMKLRGLFQNVFLSLVALPLFIYYMAKKYPCDEDKKTQSDAVFFREGRPENIIPAILRERYRNIEFNPEVKIRLSRKDKQYIKSIFIKYPFSWLFLLKILIKIGRYSYILNRYNPEAIIVASEYSFTSSVMTDYCNTVWEIKHINVQHGEKLYTIWDSFFRYDEMFVWDEYYKTLLSSLGAEEKQFKVEIPSSLVFENKIKKEKIDYCYYLASENERELLIIKQIMNVISSKGKKVLLRPHPRYSNESLIRTIFDKNQIEDVKEISIEDSLLRTKNAIAVFSTVLNQAYHNNTSIIIDDISNPLYYNRLKEMKYICLEYNHKLLSNVIGEISDEKN